MNVLGGGKWRMVLTENAEYLLEEHVPDLGKTWRRIGWIPLRRDATRIVKAMNAVQKEAGK